MKLFASDIDNTLIPQKEELTQEDIRELEEVLAEAGDVKVAYISGRNLPLVEEVLANYYLPQPDFVATDVGTLIYVFNGEDWEEDEDYRDHLALTGYNRKELEQKLREIEGIALQEEEAQTEFKLSYYLDLESKQESLPQIRKAIAESPAQLIYSEDNLKKVGLVDIIPQAGGKAGALDFLAQKLEAEEDEVVYAGDSGNDLDALSAGYNGIVVGNASGELRKNLTDHSRIYMAENDFSRGVAEGVNYFLKNRP